MSKRLNAIRLGFDSYSVRDHGWKAIQLLQFADTLKLDTVQLSSLDDFESLEPTYLRHVKNTADGLGITIDVGIGCICPTAGVWDSRWGKPGQYIAKGLTVAKALGSPCLRCFMGTHKDRGGPVEKHMESTIEVLYSVRSEVADSGVRVALENHAGDMQAREVRTIIEEAGKVICGSCLDTGNPLWAMEDPFVTLEILQDYVVTSHVRDAVVFPHRRGSAFQWVTLGDGCIHFAEFVQAFQASCPHAPIHLEIITGKPPVVLPWRERSYWKMFQHTPAWQFARFLELAGTGDPFNGTMVIAEPGDRSPALTSAMREQQIVDLRRSVIYAQRVLGLGLRAKDQTAEGGLNSETIFVQP
jgi:3-oxoisoapionate decarboxylase